MLRMDSAPCTHKVEEDIDLKNCTSIIMHTYIRSSTQNLFSVGNLMKLVQEPSEILDWDLTCRPSNYELQPENSTSDQTEMISKCSICSAKSMFCLTLNFKNVIHELVIKNLYRYEIKIFALQEIYDCHSNLFYGIETPIKKQISISFEADTLHSSWKHVCLQVYRHKIKTNYLKTNSDSLGSMFFKSECYSDVCLTVKGKDFKVHKYILSLKSKVFKAMFSEMSENQTGIVVIEDFDPEVIEEMLYYLYTQKTKNISQFPYDLCMAADKYQIDELTVECQEYLKFNLNVQNIIKILDLAELCNLKNLKGISYKFVKKHESFLSKEPSFKEFLIRDLSIDRIPHVLELCVKYSKHLANVKLEAFKFIKKHSKEMASNQKFLRMFKSHPLLMQEWFVKVHQ